MTQKGVSVALACRTFGVSERCYRYVAKLKPENERIADLLTGLTQAHRTWGFGLCFLHLRNVKGHGWNHKRVYRISRPPPLLATRAVGSDCCPETASSTQGSSRAPKNPSARALLMP